LNELKGFQRRYLRALAHRLDPVVLVGARGVTPELTASVDASLTAHELIKVRFVEAKDKESKAERTAAIAAATGSALAGMVGHVAVLYRPSPDPAKRRIRLPSAPGGPANDDGAAAPTADKRRRRGASGRPAGKGKAGGR
jgi:RNA-binding protein